MNPSRQVLTSFVVLIAYVLTFFGVELSEEIKAAMIEHINGLILSAGGLHAVILYVLRQLTTTPMRGIINKV